MYGIQGFDVSTILDDLHTDGWVTARRLYAPRPDVGGLPDPALAAPRVLRPLLHHQGRVLGDKAYSYSYSLSLFYKEYVPCSCSLW